VVHRTPWAITRGPQQFVAGIERPLAPAISPRDPRIRPPAGVVNAGFMR